MATSLAAQLQKLAVPQTSLLLRDKKRASILFDPKEAAGIDRDTFYDIGISGLKELERYNPEFSLFENSLFSTTSKQIERSVETKDVNLKINKNIRKFLMLLSPYFLLKPAHKALEWLIHRFSIHEYNKEDCLKLILPYHETNIFVRFLQILNVRQESDRWNWLRPLQKNGIHLTKLTLFNRAASEVSFLQFISEMTLQAVKENGLKANSLTTLYTFYCTCTIGALEHSAEVTEPQISAILPPILKGMTSNIPDFTASAFMIVAQMLKKCKLQRKILSQIVVKLTNGNQTHLRNEATLLVVLIYQSQEDTFSVVSEKILRCLYENDWFVSCLTKLTEVGTHVLPFLVPLLKALLETIERDDSKKLFDAVLKEIRFTDDYADIIIKSILSSCPNVSESDKKTAQWCSNLMKRLETQYPNAFDKVLREVMSSKNTNEQYRQALSSYLNFVMSVCGKDDRIGIFEKFYHPNPDFRESAVNFLVKNYPTLTEKERDIFRNGIAERLLDENKKVVKAVLNLKKKYLAQLLGKDIFIDSLITLLRETRNRNWLDVSLTVIDYLCNVKTNCNTRVFLAILPFCLPTNNDELVVALHILNTEYSNQCSILQSVKRKVPKEINAFNFCDSIYSAMNENSLPDINSLIEALNNVTGKDVIQKYLSVILTACALPKNANAELSLKITRLIFSYVESLEFSPVKNDVTSPVTNDCLKTAHNGKIPLQGFLLCLKIIVEKIHFVDVTSRWLNLNESNAYLDFVTEIFVYLLNGCASNTSKYYAKEFRVFFDKFFPSFENKIEFLCNVIVARDSGILTPRVQLRTIKVMSSVISQSNISINWGLEIGSRIFVPSILISLANPLQEIRNVAVEILSNVINTVSIKVNTYKPLLQELSNRKEEILIDNEQVGLIIFTVFEEESKFKNVLLKALFDIASDISLPSYVAAQLLNILKFVNSDDIFLTTSKLGLEILKYIGNNDTVIDFDKSNILYNIILRLNENTAKTIKTVNSPIWEMLSLAIKYDVVNLEYMKNKYSCPSVLVLEQIDRTVFANFEFDVRKSLIRLLATVVTVAENPDVVTAVNRVIRKIDLDANLILSQLTVMRDVKSEKESKQKKLTRRSILIPTADILDMKEWTEGVAVLEFIHDKKKIKNTTNLLPILFAVLKKCLEFDEQASVEYPKQLILSTILRCCDKINDADVITDSTFNMELIVQCVRASQNPQTHHHALLVLAQTANLIPEQVLHNIIAIFTFMGSSVLRHEDAYSFQIISKIIETVIPILIKVDKDGQEKNIESVLRVFVDAILDIPEHRRKPLFTKLLTTLGADEYLWLFLLLAFESHVMHGKEKQKTNQGRFIDTDVTPQRLNIATDVTLEYSAATIFNTTIKLLEYLKKLPDEKPESSIINYDSIKIFTPKQFRHYKYTLVTFVSGLLSSKRLVNQIAVMNENDTLQLESSFKNIIINILTYIQTISKVAEKNSGSPQAQYWKVMLHHSYDILDSVNALLTSEMFLLVIRGLVVHNLKTVRRKALELLNNKLQHNPSFFYTNDNNVVINNVIITKPNSDLFALLPSLIDIIKTINKDGNDEQEELLQQTALLTLKLLIKLLADENHDKFLPLIDFVTDLIKSEKAQGNILASVVLCLAELVTCLRAYAIPSLIKYMPAILKVLKHQKYQETPNLLLVCTVTALQKIVESLPLFLSPYLEKILYEISILSSKWNDEDNQKINAFIQKIKALRINIGNSIPPRVLIPVIGETYKSLLKSKYYNSVGALMNILSENLSNVNGNELNALLPELTTFFLTALQFRTDNEVDSDEIITVEDHIIEALTVLVLKLSETTFRPFYYRLYDWAVRSDTHTERIITFYRLSSGIAEGLKGLFVLFAGHFVKNASQILDECNICNKNSDKLYFSDDSKNILLIESVMKTLRTVFTYDNQSFVDKERFESLMQPLVDQLENGLGGLDKLTERSRELVVPCIAQFAVSTADDSLWKQLNYQILLKTRHDLPAVRLIGLNCVSVVAQKIGEDFLPLLPETIPFLAELLEDEDENVESACQKVVQELEKVLGEPLQKYF